MKMTRCSTSLANRPTLLRHLVTTFLAIASVTTVQGQGTVGFNYPWTVNGIGYFALDYHDGFSFRIGIRTPPRDNMAHVGVGLAGYPYNGTPYIAFINTLGIPQYVIFACTDAARFGDNSFTSGAPFGLVSVDLADPVAPSLAPIDITFNGFRPDGSMVSQTFTVGGGGSSSFQTFYFGPEFAHGLIRVEIPSPRWAMDNLVWVPEPGTYALLGLGVLALGIRKSIRRRKL